MTDTICDLALRSYHEGWGGRDPMVVLSEAVRSDPKLLDNLTAEGKERHLTATLWGAMHWAKEKYNASEDHTPPDTHCVRVEGDGQNPDATQNAHATTQDQSAFVTQARRVSPEMRERMLTQQDAGSKRRTAAICRSAASQILFGTVTVGNATRLDARRAMIFHAKQVVGNANRYAVARAIHDMHTDDERTALEASGGYEELNRLVSNAENVPDSVAVRSVRAEDMQRVQPKRIAEAS